MLYGPNEDAPELFKNILKHIEMLGNESGVAGGGGGGGGYVPLDTTVIQSYIGERIIKKQERAFYR